VSLGIFYLFAFIFVRRIKLSNDSYYNRNIIQKDKVSLELV
jgi:hypothetical protein